MFQCFCPVAFLSDYVQYLCVVVHISVCMFVLLYCMSYCTLKSNYTQKHLVWCCMQINMIRQKHSQHNIIVHIDVLSCAYCTAISPFMPLIYNILILCLQHDSNQKWLILVWAFLCCFTILSNKSLCLHDLLQLLYDSYIQKPCMRHFLVLLYQYLEKWEYFCDY